jgi:hypothetical protein
MKFWATLALLLVASLASGDDSWRDSLTPLVPGPFPPPETATLTYGFGWEGVRAATGVFVFSHDFDDDLLLLDAKVATEGLLGKLWTFRATQKSRVRASTLRTLETKQSERYRSKSLKRTLEFHPEYVIETRVRKPAGKKPGKRRKIKLPDMLDMHAGLLLLRSLPLADHDRETVVICPGSTPYLARVTVEGRERISVKAGSFDAIRARIELWKIDRDFSLKPHTKFKNATAWMSDDSRRLLLKVEASVFVGSVWAELEKVQEAKKSDPDLLLK